MIQQGSNNTNKLSPQEPIVCKRACVICSNNTNKLSPQEHGQSENKIMPVQIIQINLVLKNRKYSFVFPHLFK